MEKCWASELGDCYGKITQEHTITEEVFDSGTVCIQGFNWCKDEPKEIRRERLTRGILCQRHNNEFSYKIDPAGIDLMKFFRAEVELTKVLAPTFGNASLASSSTKTRPKSARLAARLRTIRIGA